MTGQLGWPDKETCFRKTLLLVTLLMAAEVRVTLLC